MRMLNNALGVQERQARTLTLGNEASPFGCCDFFDNCADEILSLYYKGTLGLLDWMGFNVTQDCLRSVDFLTYVRPEQYGGADTAGYIADPCADPNGVEFGSCSLSVEDFGLYGREGPTRRLLQPERYCKTRPRRFLDGSPLTSEWDWDLTFIMDQVLNDIRSHLIIGNAANAGQFDGLRRWVRHTYQNCPNLNSYVVDWNGNPMTGGAGITVNGNPVAPIYDIVDFLLDIHRSVKTRISWSPWLNNQTRQLGDTIIALPGFTARCLLDFYTCWSVCPGSQYEEVVKNSKEMREFRLTLNGGLFGHGQIALDGDVIPLLIYDWENILGPSRGDIWYLTGSVGSQRIWEGEFLDGNRVITELMETAGNAGQYFVRDGGRYVGKTDVENLCRIMKLWIALRLWCLAPWAQARFTNVACHTPLGPLSPDPSETSFYPETSFHQAACP